VFSSFNFAFVAILTIMFCGLFLFLSYCMNINTNDSTHISHAPVLNFWDSPIDVSDRIGHVMRDTLQGV